MKHITTIIFSIILFSCSKNNYKLTYRKPVKGYVFSEDFNPINDVSIKYDSLDLLSPTNIKTNHKGSFVFPKIEIANTIETKRRISLLSSQLYITKEGYKKIVIELKEFEKNEKDTIYIDTLQMKKS
ncbi:MAG: hypothetical protein QM535_04350 [Limnohabitans sp.]|nr:hypothetical protein [Limnohabitans sp.]